MFSSLIDIRSRLPELRSFIKDGEAKWYYNVDVNIVRGQHAILHVYNTTIKTNSGNDPIDRAQSRRLRSNNRQVLTEIATVSLSSVSTKAEMHQLMQQYGFVLKSLQDRQKELDSQERKQRMKNFATHFRREYVRQQFYHAYYFRQDVMKDTIYYNNMTWNGNNDHDFLCQNYDHIFKMQVIDSDGIRRYANDYLIQCGRIT